MVPRITRGDKPKSILAEYGVERDQGSVGDQIQMIHWNDIQRKEAIRGVPKNPHVMTIMRETRGWSNG